MAIFMNPRLWLAALAALFTVSAATLGPMPPDPQSCQQLVAKYDGSNWWGGAFGNCKMAGGPTTPDLIFQCAWKQVPANEKTECLKAALLQTGQTRRGNDVVIAANSPRPDICNQLKIKDDGSNWWWGALGNCKKPNGPTDRNAIFDCAWSQVPPAEQNDCLKTALQGSDQTRR